MNKQAVPYKTKICISALTDAGKVRTHNEDNFIVCTDLDKNSWVLTEGWIELAKKGCVLVLADGMGGANAGEIASSIAVEAIKEYFSALSFQMVEQEAARKEFLLAAISKAHDKILARAKSDQAFEGMGTTIVIAWAIQSKLYVCWCGDSRAYIYNAAQGLRLITRDHSLVWELVEAGKLTPDEADTHPDNNIITQSLGDPARSPKPDIVVEALEAGDKILLCSDGLNNMVDAKTIENALSSESSLTQIAKGLIQLANAQGGKDNITVILLQSLISDSAPQKGRQKKKHPLIPVVPVVLIFVILVSISFIWEGNNRDIKRASGTAILSHDADSSPGASSDNKPSRGKTRKLVLDSPSAKSKNSLPFSSLTEGQAPDSLKFIGSRIKDLQTLMLKWNGAEKIIDSLQIHSKKLNGKEMLRLTRLVSEFENFAAREHLQRLVDEWDSFQSDPDSKVLSRGFVIAALDRKIEEGNEILFRLDESLNSVKLRNRAEHPGERR